VNNLPNQLARPAILPARPAHDVRPIITHMISVVRRRRWLLIGIVATALVIGLITTLLMTPMYRAVSVIDIRREDAAMVNTNPNDLRSASADQEFYETQYGLLKARALAERVAAKLRLADDPRFFQSFHVGKDWFDDGQLVEGASTRDQRTRAAAGILLEHFDLEHERLSRLVEIQFSSPDPALSKRVIDAWGTEFIQLTLDQRFGASTYARNFLRRRLVQLRSRIDESERRVVDYAAREGIVNLPGQTGAGGEKQPERSLVADNLAAFNQQLAQATAGRLQAESRLGETVGLTAEALQSPVASTLRQQRAGLAGDYARMMAQFSPEYPPARALSRQIAQLDQSIKNEEGRVRQGLSQAFKSASERENALRQQVSALKTQVLSDRRRSIQYNIFLRDADTNRVLYDALLQRFKEIDVAGGVAINNISIVDPAETPGGPYSPRLLINLAVALVAGLILGGAVAWVLEQIDQGLSEPGEVESEIGLPLLGAVPKLAGDVSILERLQDRKSEVTEAYLSARTSLSFASDHGVPQSLAVTSTRPAEGKSTTSYALALALARSGRQVLLIDGDMRSPSIHNMLNIRNGKGLSNYLSGSETLQDTMQPLEEIGLSVMTAGPQPPSTPELLAGSRFEVLLQEAGARFDHVIIDAPPVMGLADAPIIGSKINAMIYVVEAHGTQKRMAKVAISRLQAAHAQIAGVILTKFDPKQAHYGYGYGYGTGYSYGKSSAGDRADG
jgi:succinoglycan biosynthesis transport protein ExoP